MMKWFTRRYIESVQSNNNQYNSPIKRIPISVQGIGLVFLFVFTVVISLVRPSISSAETKFSDLQGHWAKPCIESLVKKKLLSGNKDGTFRTKETVTRAEFASMITKAFPKAPEVRKPIRFADIPSKYWAAEAIRKAYTTGFMSSYIDRVFNPTHKVERWQAIASVASGLKYKPTTSAIETLKATFTDADEIPKGAENAIASATEKQLVVNYPDVEKLRPNQLINRAEIAALFCQALDESELVPQEYIARVKPTPTPTPTPTSELRGVWLTNIDSDVLFSSAKLDKGLQSLKQLNFNTLYPTVWNWGNTLYPSKVAKKVIGRAVDPEPGLRNRDMLKEIIAKGHQQGFTVIPWFEFGFMAPADSDLAKRHPKWLTKRSNGTQVVKEGKHDRVWLNPFHPEVQQFIEDLVIEIVNNYKIDGIQFDDHFGLPSELGYDDFTVALYKKEHNGQAPSTNPLDPEWVKWRAEIVTNFMKRVFRAIKAKNQDCLVSFSPNPQRFSYEYFLADWETWERQGFIEELVLQVYRDDLNVFISELQQPEVQAARRNIPVSIGIITGLKDRFVPLKQIQEQVKEVRDRNFAGLSFFFYESLWNLADEKPAERQSSFAKFFPTPIKPPNLIVGWEPASS